MAETTETITLDMLTSNSVSVIKQTYVEVGGTEYPIGEPWRRAYVNSESGRSALESELPEPYRSAVLAVWGDHPTVSEATEE